MKIAFLNIYQGRINRGAETFVSEISKRLAKEHKVIVFKGRKKPARRWPVLWRAFLDPHGIQGFFWTVKLLPAIWRGKFDVVIPINGGWQPALIRIITWIYGGKMVISGQSGIGWDDRNNLWAFPDVFVPLSKKAKKWAKRAMPLVKLKYIPNGVDTNKFSPEGKKLKTKLKRPIVLCAAALAESKRIDLTIEAISKLKNVSLLVAGDGDLKRQIEKLGKEKLDDRFQLTSIPFEEMPKVYRAADVFTVASAPRQAFEIVLVEAMATNLPVIANNDPIRRKIVGKAGLLVDPTDVSAYAKSIKEVLQTDWGDKPRDQAKKFDWNRIYEEYQKLFEELV